MRKNKNLLTVLIFILVGSLTVNFGQIKSKKLIAKEAKAAVKHISVVDVQKKINDGVKFYLIDVRTTPEYLAGHVQGAILIPRGLLEFKIGKIVPDPNADIVIYCKTGGRGSLAVKTLMDMGYKNVKDMDGGFKNWVKKGFAFFNHHGKLKALKFGDKEKRPNGVGVLDKLVQ